MELLLNILSQILNELGAFKGSRKLPKKKLATDEVKENSPADRYVHVWVLVCFGLVAFYL